MGKRSGVAETDEAIAALSETQLQQQIAITKRMITWLGPLPRKGAEKRLRRLEKALAERLAGPSLKGSS